jgi:hypothetical protein
MSRQIAARSLPCFGVPEASGGEQRSLWADASLPLEPVETHHLKSTLPVCFSTLLLEEPPDSDQNNDDRRTVHTFVEYCSVFPIAHSVTPPQPHSLQERFTC